MVEDEDPITWKTMMKNVLTYDELHATLIGIWYAIFYMFVKGIVAYLILVAVMVRYYKELHYFLVAFMIAYLVVLLWM